LFDQSLQTALTVSLEQSAHANVFPDARVTSALTRMQRDPASRIDPELGREICRRENIRALVSCGIARVGPRYVLSARIVDPRTGETVRSYDEQADGQDKVLPALSSLAADIRRGLGESLSSIERSNRPLPQVTTASLRALQLYADGQRLWAKGQHPEAVKLYESALQLDPEFAMAYSALGNAYSSFVFNQPVKGRAYYDNALRLSTRTTERERLLIEASAASATGNVQEAERVYRAYLAMYADDSAVRYSLGTMLMMNNRSGEALEQFLDVVRVAPQDAGAFINAATSYAKLRKYPEALEYYRRAFVLEPTWEGGGNLNHEYGFAVVRAGEVSKAREVFSKALGFQDSKAGGLRSLALLDMYEGRYREAETKLREAIILNRAAKQPLSEARNLMFLAQVRQGRDPRAAVLAELDRADVLLAPLDTDVGWYANLGTFLARAGVVGQAKRLVTVVAKRAEPGSPSDMSALHGLEGEIALAERRYEKAIDSLALADRELRNGLALESLANAYRIAGNSAQAIATYEALLALDAVGWEAQPGWLAAHYALADAYRKTNQIDRARETADKLLNLWKEADPDLPFLQKIRELRRLLDR
jgi:tetratricopeptide (TPR) repeat protein